MNPALMSMMKAMLGIDPESFKADMSAFVNGVKNAIDEIKCRQERIENKLDAILSRLEETRDV